MPTVTVSDVLRKGNLVHTRSHDTNVTCRQSTNFNRAHSSYGDRRVTSGVSNADRRCKTSLAITRSVTDHFEFEESYNTLASEFDVHDYHSNGYVSKPDFNKVLQEVGFFIPVKEFDSFLSQNGVRSRLGHVNYRDFLESYEKSEGSILTDRSTASADFHLDLGPVVDKEEHTSNKRVLTKKTQQNSYGPGHCSNEIQEHINETTEWNDRHHHSEVVSAEKWADRTTDLQITGRTYREPYDKVTANQMADNTKKQMTKHVASHKVAFRDPDSKEIVSKKNNVSKFSTNDSVGNKNGTLTYSTNEKAEQEQWVTHPSNQIITSNNWEKSNRKEIVTEKEALVEEDTKSKSVKSKSIGSFPMTQNQLDSHITTQMMAARKNSGKPFVTKAQNKWEQYRSQIFTPPSTMSVHNMLPQGNFTTEELLFRVNKAVQQKSSSILSNCRSHDKLSLGVITQPEFQSAIETSLGYQIPDRQWEELKPRFGRDLGGLVTYNTAIQKFNEHSERGDLDEVLQTSRIVPKKVVTLHTPRRNNLPPKTYRKPHVRMNNWTTHEGQQQMAAGGVPANAKTQEYYRTENIPNRFDNPEWFQGYGGKQQHPMYRTSAADYGSKKPTVHTMPTQFHARSQKFSMHLGTCGMYRNHSLNTSLDQSRV